MNRCAAGSPPGFDGSSALPFVAGTASRPTFGAATARRRRNGHPGHACGRDRLAPEELAHRDHDEAADGLLAVDESAYAIVARLRQPHEGVGAGETEGCPEDGREGAASFFVLGVDEAEASHGRCYHR